MKHKHKKIIQWTIACICLGYIGVFFWQQREQLRLALKLNIPLLLLIQLMLFVYYLCYSYRYLLVIEKCSGVKVPYWGWFRLCVLGLFLNKFVPQMGNIYRGARLKQDYQVSYTRYASVYFSFAWMDTCLNMFIAMIVMMTIEPELQIAGIKAGLIIAALLIMIVLIPGVFLSIFRFVESKTRRTFWIQSKLSEVLEVTTDNIRDIKYLGRLLVLTLLTFGVMATVQYIGFSALGFKVTVPAIIIFYALYKLGTYLNITPGNLGIRELAYGFLSEFLGIGMAEGIMVSAVFRIFTYTTLSILAVPLGGWDLLRKGDQYRPPKDVKPRK